MLLRARYLLRLVRELVGFAVTNRAWWLLPMMVLLGAVTVLIVVGQAAAPYTLYTVF